MVIDHPRSSRALEKLLDARKQRMPTRRITKSLSKPAPARAS